MFFPITQDINWKVFIKNFSLNFKLQSDSSLVTKTKIIEEESFEKNLKKVNWKNEYLVSKFLLFHATKTYLEF